MLWRDKGNHKEHGVHKVCLQHGENNELCASLSELWVTLSLHTNSSFVIN